MKIIKQSEELKFVNDYFFIFYVSIVVFIGYMQEDVPLGHDIIYETVRVVKYANLFYQE